MLAQAEALVSACADDRPDAAAALDRIADIAFVLHERDVEPSLCDALDAAMREIGDANARNRASVQRAHEAVELLRLLRRRVDAMLANAHPASSSSAMDRGQVECADEFPAPARLFDGGIAADGAFAQTVAVLVETLPAQDRGAAAHFQNHGSEDGGSQSESFAPSDVAAQTPEVVVSSSGAEDAAARDAVAETTVPVPSSNPAAVADQAPANTAAAAPIAESIDPDDDPGDLFEPAPGSESAADASAPLPITTAVSEEAAPVAAVAPASPGPLSGAPAYAAPRPAASDPLAPIRALSEEELIALFS